jgi:hypothetical protein
MLSTHFVSKIGRNAQEVTGRIICLIFLYDFARSNMLLVQVGRSRARSPMKLLDLSIYLILPGWTTEGPSSSPGRVNNFLHVVQTGAGVHTTSYPMGTGSSFPGSKAAGA